MKSSSTCSMLKPPVVTRPPGCGTLSLSREFVDVDSDNYTAPVQRGPAAHARNSLGTCRAWQHDIGAQSLATVNVTLHEGRGRIVVVSAGSSWLKHNFRVETFGANSEDVPSGSSWVKLATSAGTADTSVEFDTFGWKCLRVVRSRCEAVALVGAVVTITHKPRSANLNPSRCTRECQHLRPS